jgi:hypothetical protein
MRAAMNRTKWGPTETELAKTAAEEFRFDLIDRFAAGRLGAIDLATIAWCATAAGAGGANDLAVNPDTQGANQARKVRSALGLDDVVAHVLYECRIPVWDVATASRIVKMMYVKLPHEAIARDYRLNKDAYLKARSDIDNIEVPSFLDHPNTIRFGKEACWPVGYYTDKVKLGNDSFYRGSVKCTVMRSSITVWLLKCHELCRCGCAGLCTIDALQMEMNWSFNALQRDTFMESRFDKRHWLPTETKRKQRAGTIIGFRGVVNEYRADLPERCAAARVKNQAGHLGCLGCLSRSSELHSRVAEVSFCSVPWVARTQESYVEEVSSHLVMVQVHDVAERTLLAKSLQWIHVYPWGRRVEANKGARWGLKSQDQLIVSDSLLNPHDLGTLTPPFQVDL